MDKRFTNEIITAAQTAQHQTNVPASVTMAQWALESAYGTEMPSGSNNPFGIKAKGGAPYVMAMTTEIYNGKSERLLQPFAKYATLGDAFIAHGHLLETVSLYKQAMETWLAGDLMNGISLMAKHYATDPNYSAKIKDIIARNNLDSFDKLSPANVAQSPAISKPAPQGIPNMNLGVIQAALSAVVTFGPQMAGDLFNGISNRDKIIAAAEDMLAKIKLLDLQDASADFDAILSYIGLSPSTLASVIAKAITTAPPAGVASTSNVASLPSKASA